MTLEQYLVKTRETHTAFARRVKATQTAVSFWVAGKRFPRPAYMRKITAATGGKVTRNDFLRAMMT